MRLAVVALAASILAGCGGGGGSDSTSSASPQFTAPSSTNPSAALAKFFATSAAYRLAGTASNGTALTATITVAPNGAVSTAVGNFNQSTITLAVYQGSALYATNSQIVWLYQTGPSIARYFNSSDSSCFVNSAAALPPSTATLGATGSLGSGPQFSGCRTDNLPMTYWTSSGDVTALWEYKTMDSGMPMVCINTTTKALFITSQEQDCIEVTDSAGNIGGRMRVNITYTGSNSPNVTLNPA